MSMTTAPTMPRPTNQRGRNPVRRPMLDDTSMNTAAILMAKT